MRYTNIGKALSTLTSSEMSAKVAEHIACKLSQKQPTEVKALDIALGFTLPVFRRRNASTEEMLANRRVALLMAKTLAAPAPRPGSVYNPEAWDDAALVEYIGAQKASVDTSRRPTRSQSTPGTYFSAGFWVHATEADRNQALTSWREGKELCAAGLMAVVNSLKARPTQTGEHKVMEAGMDLVEFWFGEGADRKEIKRVLHETLQGMNSQFICLTYAGPIPDASLSVWEAGFGNSAAHSKTAEKGGWGQVGKNTPNTVFLCKNFFDPGKTSGPRQDQLVGIDDDMQVSRGGCALHEATHMFGDTNDVQVGDEVYERFGKTPPAASETRAQGYGPATCIALARSDPEKTVKNADSYRMFCETAKYFRNNKSA